MTRSTRLFDVLGIGISADRFFMHEGVVGINLVREGVTIAQVREWHHFRAAYGSSPDRPPADLTT
jgi:hypothetical protein